MSFPKAVALCLVMIIWFASVTPSRADTIVTACGSDLAAGGTNLDQALLAGGAISIRCATGGDSIRMSRVHILTTNLSIDGGGKVTLVGPGSGTMFQPAPFTQLSFKGLSLRNPVALPSDREMFTGIVYDPSDSVVVILDNVQVTDTRLPFVVRTFNARNSGFTRNGDGSNPDFGVIMAGQMTLLNTTFRDNAARPFMTMWRGAPAGKAFRGSITNCMFTGNKRPAIWVHGTFTSDGSRFEGNGHDAGRYSQSAPMHLLLDLPRIHSSAGALDLFLTRATIQNTSFTGNHGDHGGAVLAQSSTVSLQVVTADRNSALSGGAIVSLRGGVPLDDDTLGGALELSNVKMRGNTASEDGGAIVTNGDVHGVDVLFSGNRAGRNGGAIAFSPPEKNFAAAQAGANPAQVPLMPAGSLSLSRAFLLDQVSAGPTVDGQSAAALRLGNVLAVRNGTRDSKAAVLRGSGMSLAGSTLADNTAAGLDVIPGGSGATLANTILTGNKGGNCSSGSAGVTALGGNVQNPASDCGDAVSRSDPALDSRYAPALTSSARNGGSPNACAEDPLVGGVDVYGEERAPSNCSIGAVETDTRRDLEKKITSMSGGRVGEEQIMLGGMALFVLCVLLGLLAGFRHRRRRRQ